MSQLHRPGVSFFLGPFLMTRRLNLEQDYQLKNSCWYFGLLTVRGTMSAAAVKRPVVGVMIKDNADNETRPCDAFADVNSSCS